MIVTTYLYIIIICGHRQVIEAYYYSRITDEISDLSEISFIVVVVDKIFIQSLDGYTQQGDDLV